MAGPEDKSILEKGLESAENATSDYYDQERKTIPEWDNLGKVEHDVKVGVLKGVYHGTKSLVGGVIDLIRLGIDPEAQRKFVEAAWPVVVSLAKEAAIAQSGDPRKVQDQNQRIIAFAKKVYSGFEKDWEEAGKTDGKRTELAAKWVSRAGFEVAALFVGAGEAKDAVDAARLAKLAEEQKALEALNASCEAAKAKAAAEAEEAAKAAQAAEDAAKAKADKEASDAFHEAETVKVKRPPNPELVEQCGKPSHTTTFRPEEVPYHNPPEMHVVRPGEPLDVSKLDPKKRYLWAVDEHGNMIVAPEKQAGFGVTAAEPEGRYVKHGDLIPGPEGAHRGKARSAGELQAVVDGNGKPTGDWVMNNDSSYTFAREDGRIGTADNLNASHKLLTDSGTDTSKIIPVNTTGAQ